MKTCKHLYEQIIEPEYIKRCIQSASIGKRKREMVRSILDYPEPVVNKIIKEITTDSWKPPHHSKQKLQEGSHRKQRIIEKPQFNNEQIIHHMLINIIKPKLTNMFYEQSCGCIPGRGPYKAMKTLVRWKNEYLQQGKMLYVAELDIKKFYQNVDVNILKIQLQKFIKDDKYLKIMNKVIDGSAPGLPLGYYTSPWLGNLYLTPLDRYILHSLHPNRYLRYMDNLYLLHNNKDELHKIVRSIMSYCTSQLKISIKDDWQVFQFEYDGKGRAINCLGYIIHEHNVTLRKTLLKRIRAKALRMHDNHQCRLIDARAMVSYSGWLQNSDTYNYYLKWIKPNISFIYCKKLISKKSKKQRSDNNDRLEDNAQQLTK